MPLQPPPRPDHLRRRRRLAAGLLGGAALLAGATIAVFDSEPLVPEPAAADGGDLARVMALARVHDPRRSPAGRERRLVLLPTDLDVVAAYAGALHGRARVRVELEHGRAAFSVSLPAPLLAGRAWLNVVGEFEERARGLPRLAAWRVGALPLPPAWAPALLRLASLAPGAPPGLAELPALGAETIRELRLAPEALTLAYAWREGGPARLLGAFVPAAELQRLRAYTSQLADLLHPPPGAAAAVFLSAEPLPRVMSGLFALARERSRGATDAVAAAENRSALLALTLHASGRPLAALLPASGPWALPAAFQPVLGGRDDFALHLLISATLAAEANGTLAQLVGLTKEMSDSRRGSGFSFNDMAANRAGQRLGERAVREPHALQQRLAQGLADADLLPPLADLPEFLSEAELQRRFGGVGAAPYEALMAEIERRVAALAVLR